MAAALAAAVLTCGQVRGEDEAVATFERLLAAGIVSFVDKEFTIEGVVTWDTPTVKIPEDPRTPAELAALAGPLKVRLQGKAFEGLEGRDRLLLVSDKLSKAKGADGTEVWAFDGKRLVRDGGAYRLRVRLMLRASFKKELLQNPAFVKQSNQPKYWAQTFEMELLGVSETGNRSVPEDEPQL